MAKMVRFRQLVSCLRPLCVGPFHFLWRFSICHGKKKLQKRLRWSENLAILEKRETGMMAVGGKMSERKSCCESVLSQSHSVQHCLLGHSVRLLVSLGSLQATHSTWRPGSVFRERSYPRLFSAVLLASHCCRPL